MPAPKEKHLEFIQNAISRLAGNSFQMKAWNVALATAVIGFAAAKEGKPPAAILAVVPALAFWFLDAYFLGLERSFRAFYNSVIAGKHPDYAMQADVSFGQWLEALLRPSVFGLHVPLIAVVVAALKF